MVSGVLTLMLLAAPGNSLAGPPERVSGRMVLDDVPSAFLSDIRAGRWDAAYGQTSAAFRHYISRTDFPTWVQNHEAFGRVARLSRARPRTGRNCRGEVRSLLDVGVRLNGEQVSRVVFAWEDGRWRFDHVP
jgi:hypothetical protein